MGHFVQTLVIGAILAIGLAWIMLRTGFLQGPVHQGSNRAMAFVIAATLGSALVLSAASIVDSGVFNYNSTVMGRHRLRPESAGFWFFVGLFWVPGVFFWSLALANLFRKAPTRQFRSKRPPP